MQTRQASRAAVVNGWPVTASCPTRSQAPGGPHAWVSSVAVCAAARERRPSSTAQQCSGSESSACARDKTGKGSVAVRGCCACRSRRRTNPVKTSAPRREQAGSRQAHTRNAIEALPDGVQPSEPPNHTLYRTNTDLRQKKRNTPKHKHKQGAPRTN